MPLTGGAGYIGAHALRRSETHRAGRRSNASGGRPG
jgi:hypothetical protein